MKIVNHSVKASFSSAYPFSVIEQTAKTCYQSELAKTYNEKKEFVRRLIKNGHTAMLEFVDITFRIVTDRGVMCELTRHRMASYAIESSRYCNYKDKDIEFIKPVCLIEEYNDNSDTPYELWLEHMKQSEEYYKHFISCGYSPQIARSVLPNSLKTEICMKMNMRSFRNFIQLRTAKTAHPDMQHIANLCVYAVRDTEYFVFIEDLVE